MKQATAILVSLGLLSATWPAMAHFSLDYPKGRSQEIDAGPCGLAGSTRGSTVTTFRPGETITLKWQIFIEHGVKHMWRISIDDSGQDFPDPMTANDKSTLPFFMDMVEVAGETMHELPITLPNITCTNCTLQMLQYKYEVAPFSQGFYYQCADITIAGDPTGGTSTTTTGGPVTTTGPTTTGSGGGGAGSSTGGSSASTSSTSSTSSTTTSGGSGGSGSNGPAAAGDSGGCSLARTKSAGTNSAWFALALLAFARRRKRV
jgi:hypothetical protein